MLRSAADRGAPRRFGLRVVAALAAVTLGLLGVTLAVAPAEAATGFSGTLVDQLGDPVLGLEFIIHENDGSPSGVDHHVTSDPTTGDFSLTGLADGQYYLIIGDNPITGGYSDVNGDTYQNFGGSFYFLPGNEDLGQIVLQKRVDVSGTIANWTSAMGNLDVQVLTDVGGGNWQTVSSGDSVGASFSIPTAVVDGDYTLYFQLPSTSTAPFLDAFLGGEFFDPASAAAVPGIAGTPITGISMTMPDAAFITGTVTDAVTGDGIPGIDVSTEDRPDELFGADTLTDADGHYTLRVIPGLTYAVFADDMSSTYYSMTYQNLDGCGCTFTPVHSTNALPATGIDFALIVDTEADIAGFVLDGSLSSGTANPFDGVTIHLYKPVTGGWSEVTTTQTDSGGDFQLVLPSLGSYRLRFEMGGVWLPAIDGLAGPGSASGPVAISGCFIDTGTLDASSVVTHVAFAVLAGLNQAGGCTAEPSPNSGTGSTGGTSGHGSTGHGRSVIAASDTTVATPTPTPTATSTPTPSPSASTPGDSVSTPKPTAPAPAGLDLTWLWIVLAIIAALIIAFFVIRGLRRP